MKSSVFTAGNEPAWRKWYDENEPESVPIPDYDERINMDRTGTAVWTQVL